MPHFAKLNKDNIVEIVLVGRVEDDGKEDELTARTGDVYKQTSYNTYGGVHYDSITNQPSDTQHKAFRKNFAGVGFIYDVQRDAFIAPKPFASWVLNENTCCWDAPTPMPQDGKMYKWDEPTTSWIELPPLE